MIKGIGVDIVLISRFKEKQEKFAQFILTEKEYFLYKKSLDKLSFLAGRFAAKEALFKAFKGKYSLLDFEILNAVSGEPISNHGLISISHDGDYAIAYAINTGGDNHE
ncbi:MAG: holo-ACP synthase [Bacilli bacterium]|nr:holo-ACP synthase [Bacilli bacterium]